jgi:hypothetical protein
LLQSFASDLSNIASSPAKTVATLFHVEGRLTRFVRKRRSMHQDLAQATGIREYRFIKGNKKPTIVASVCCDEKGTGGWKYNGGIKELNLLVRLLRAKGYEAYMMTYDGGYDSWLIEHQPHISLSEFRELIRSRADTRCVTSWALASAFINELSGLYFWDMELKYTEHNHFSTLAHLYRHKIQNVTAISRTIQAWHMAHFGKHCSVLPALLDNNIWRPDERGPTPFRVGYMHEGDHTEEYLDKIKQVTRAGGLDLDFHRIQGAEVEVLASMQTCEVFLSMNTGKDLLWGEGCPITVLEALSTGCVVIAFDIIGNRELIHSNFNGLIVNRYQPHEMATTLFGLYRHPMEMETLRQNALSMVARCHSLESRWPAVRDFLELPND